METDERPSKIPKLSHDDAEPKNGTLPADAQSHDIHAVSEERTAAASQYADDENIAKGNAVSTAHADTADVSGDVVPQDEMASPAENDSATQDASSMSKNQLKKMRKKAEWEAKRGDRKALRKEKLVAKRERKRAAKENEVANPEPIVFKQRLYQRAVQLPITFVIDCDFDDLMTDSERISLASQVTRCYSDNKAALFRAHLTFCSFGGQLRRRFDTVLSSNYKSWKGVRALDHDFVETAQQAKEWMRSEGVLGGMFSKYAGFDDEAIAQLQDDGEIVYLSSEADEDLTELKPYSTYIIGGLVDKNRHKGICHKRATERGVRTARLPIGQYMELQSRKILTTNHVNEIMIKWLASGDWSDAFMTVIPKRKGGTLREHSEETAADVEEVDDQKEATDDQRIPTAPEETS